jgi:peroxiredoxin
MGKQVTLYDGNCNSHIYNSGWKKMQEFLVVSTVLSWLVILLNLFLSLALVRRFRDLDKRNEPETLKVGTKVPDFSLETLDGKTVKLADYKNQESLMVFVSPTCNPCRAQMPNLKELFPRIEAAGIRFLLVSLGAKDETQTFIEEFQMQAPVLLSENASPFALDYKVPGTPAYYRIDKQGLVKAGGFFDQDWQEMTQKWAN